jgi:hypothetical protein
VRIVRSWGAHLEVRCLALRWGIYPHVLCHVPVPCLIIERRVVVDPRVVRHAGAPYEKRQGIWPHRITQLPALTLNNVPVLLAHKGRCNLTFPISEFVLCLCGFLVYHL